MGLGLGWRKSQQGAPAVEASVAEELDSVLHVMEAVNSALQPLAHLLHGAALHHHDVLELASCPLRAGQAESLVRLPSQPPSASHADV